MTQPRTAMSAAISQPAPASRRRRALLTAGAASGATSVIGGGGLLATGLLTGRSVQAQGKLGKAVYGQGSIDPIFPVEHGEALAASASGAKMVRIEGGGHEMHPGHWDLIIGEIRRHTAGAA